jgi:galactose-1-phosphate uridylyltransferase
MQFRERRKVFQVIRTIYDPAIKRGRSEVVGRIERDGLAVDPALLKACSAAEMEEIESFLAQVRLQTSREAAAKAAADLPAQMRLAETWFNAQAGAHCGPLAAEVWTAWKDLAKALRKAGVGKSRRRA